MREKIDEFLTFIVKQKKYSDNTCQNYGIDLDEFYLYLKKEGINYTDVDYKCVKGYLVDLYDKNLSRNTISRKLSSLRSFYKYLFNNEIVNVNPFKFVSSPKKEKKLPKYLTISEIKELFEVPNIESPLGQRDRLILEVLYSSGIRVGELVNIKIEDIDFFNKEIRILGKGNKERIALIGDSCIKYINLFINDGRKKILGKHHITSDYLIINEHGKNITTRGVELLLDNIEKRTFIKKKITPHMLRHSYATHLLNEGCDILTVKELLGHESLESTQVYTHVSNERLKEVYMKCHPLNRK